MDAAGLAVTRLTGRREALVASGEEGIRDDLGERAGGHDVTGRRIASTGPGTASQEAFARRVERFVI